MDTAVKSADGGLNSNTYSAQKTLSATENQMNSASSMMSAINESMEYQKGKMQTTNELMGEMREEVERREPMREKITFKQLEEILQIQTRSTRTHTHNRNMERTMGGLSNS